MDRVSGKIAIVTGGASGLGRASATGDAAGARKAVVEDGADANAAVFKESGAVGGPYTAAYVAACHGHCGVLDVLLAAPFSADPDKVGDTHNGWTPCHVACRYDHPTRSRCCWCTAPTPTSPTKTGSRPA